MKRRAAYPAANSKFFLKSFRCSIGEITYLSDTSGTSRGLGIVYVLYKTV